jgi:hypothetical protein
MRDCFDVQGSAGALGNGEPSAPLSVLDAVPDFIAAPLEQGARARQRQQQQSSTPEADNSEGSGPPQV